MAYRLETEFRQSVVSVAGKKLILHWDTNDLLSKIVEDAVTMIDGDGGALTLEDPREGVYRCVAIYNLPEALLSVPLLPNQGIASYIFQTGEPQVIADDCESFPGVHPVLSHLGTRSAVGVPLKVAHEVVGTLVVSTRNQDRQFHRRDLDVLQRFANMAALAIQNARLHFENLRSLNKLRKAETKLAHQAQRLRVLLSRVFDAQEEERRRIAAELHDSVVQSIVAAHLELSLSEQLVYTAPADAIAAMSTANTFLGEAHSDIRDVIMNLRPARLDRDGLIVALDHLTRSVQDPLGLQCGFTMVGQAKRLDSNKEITAYRIVQEAVTNVWKHASATHLNVRIQFEKKRVVVVVEDDGQGFDVSQVDSGCATQHLGLVSMRERAESIGGSLRIDSRIRRGTRVCLAVPLVVCQEKEPCPITSKF